jgi:hypothetical protein
MIVILYRTLVEFNYPVLATVQWYDNSQRLVMFRFHVTSDVSYKNDAIEVVRSRSGRLRFGPRILEYRM